MRLLRGLEQQAERVRRYKDRKNWESVDQAAGPARRQAQQLHATMMRLGDLAAIPPALIGDTEERLGTARAAVAGILEWWDTWYESQPSVGKVVTLQSKLQGANSRAGQDAQEAIAAIRKELDRLLKDIGNAEFLAQELGLDSQNIAEKRSDLRKRAKQVEELLGAERKDVPRDWKEVSKRYEEEACPRACLLRAQLDLGVTDLVTRLLEAKQLPLVDVPREALQQLVESPALARLCHIAMLREPKEGVSP